MAANPPTSHAEKRCRQAACVVSILSNMVVSLETPRFG